MKIALVCDWYHPRIGGIELHLQDLARRLTATGHEVVVITPTPGAPVVDGIRVRRIDAPRAPKFGFLVTGGGVRALGDALAEERVDVAHCHVSIVSPAALGGALRAERLETPAVLTFHSVVPHTDLLARATNAAFGTSRWNVKFSAVSARVAREIAPIAGANPIEILPNGIDVAFWRVGLKPRTDDTLRLVSVMRLNPKKRGAALIPIMQQIRTLMPDRRVGLRIVGDGPERGRLQRALRRARLDDTIELLGRRSRNDIRMLFAESDLFVLPTIRESFGLAALEARCAGLPVIAMAASGVAEIIAHDKEGLHANSDAELAEHVVALANNADRRRAIATHNRTTVPIYDWPRVIDAHLAIYREAIALRANV